MDIVIADDHALFRSGIRQLMALEFPDADVTEAASLDDVFSALSLHASPDLLVLDLNMPGVNGVDSIAALIDIFPRAKVVILSASEARHEVGAAIAAGIDGYIPKSLQTAEILSALKSIMGGATYVPLSVTRRAAFAEDGAPHNVVPVEDIVLTERQRHVLDELVLGKTSKQIGRALDIAENTVKIHLAGIYRAFGVKSRSEAIAKATGHSLCAPDRPSGSAH